MATDENQRDDASRIVCTFVDRNAPTAEGMCYVTANGDVWREQGGYGFVRTGYGPKGYVQGRRIYPAY